jgi:hypothetical protein
MARFTRKNLTALFEEYESKLQKPVTPEQIEEIYQRWKAGKLFLHRVNTLIEGFGTEAIMKNDGTTAAIYVNLGETYATTIVRDCKADVYRIESWGDYAERTPNLA